MMKMFLWKVARQFPGGVDIRYDENVYAEDWYMEWFRGDFSNHKANFVVPMKWFPGGVGIRYDENVYAKDWWPISRKV